MKAELRDLRGKIEKLRQESHEIIKQAGDNLDMNKVTVISGDSATKVAYMQALNMELEECMKKAEPLEVEHNALIRSREQLKKFGTPLTSHPGFGSEDGYSGDTAVATPGKAFIDAWRESGNQKGKSFEIDLGEQSAKMLSDVYAAGGIKTTLATSAGWAPQALRTGRMVEYATRPIQLIDILPSASTGQSAIVYMEETTFTPAAVETAEAGQYQEAALAYTERNVPVRKIPVFIPVTDEQLDDIPGMQSLLNNRLPFFIRQRLDGQIVAGTGIAPNLVGLSAASGTQTQARGTDPGPDALYKAMVKVRITGRSQPSAIALHPTDLQNIRLLRTADGIYIFGNPTDGATFRIWGLPVAEADSLTAGTGWVGDFAGFSELVERRGIEVKVSDSHSDFFIKGLQAVRADFRCAIVWYRPSAFCSVTGM